MYLRGQFLPDLSLKEDEFQLMVKGYTLHQGGGDSSSSTVGHVSWRSRKLRRTTLALSWLFPVSREGGPSPIQGKPLSQSTLALKNALPDTCKGVPY